MNQLTQLVGVTCIVGLRMPSPARKPPLPPRYINVVNASRHADGLIDFAISRRFGFSTWDQGALEKHFGGTTAHPWDWLDDAVINSRGFLPVHQFMDKVSGRSRAAIWHWHGYKANQMQCLFRAIRAGTWNITGAYTM